MTRLFPTLISVLLFGSLFGQTDPKNNSQTIPTKVIKGDSIKLFIDSLKLSILKDTAKFNYKDLININGRTENTNPYSTLITVDLRYSYRLDIINGAMVAKFVSEVLNPSFIDVINVIEKPNSMEIFGSQGNNGCIIISFKRKTKFNFKVAGLKYNKKRKAGNNFDQRKKGEIMIRT